MKLKFIGESFYSGFGLTDGKIYECTEVDMEDGLVTIIDDEEEEYLYSIRKPMAPNGTSEPGKWEIIEDTDGILEKAFKKFN